MHGFYHSNLCAKQRMAFSLWFLSNKLRNNHITVSTCCLNLSSLNVLFLYRNWKNLQCVFPVFFIYNFDGLSIIVQDAAQVSVGEIKPTDGACCLQLKLPSNKKPPPGFWNFLKKYGFSYGDGVKRPLLPREVSFLPPACFLLDHVTFLEVQLSFTFQLLYVG